MESTTVNDRPRLSDDPDLRLSSVHAEPLALELFELLSRLIDDQHSHLTIELESTGRYVQAITGDGSWLQVESVGDHFVADTTPITDEEQIELERLGWAPPRELPHGWSNWTVGWDTVDLHDAAQLLALTLCRVHHLFDPDDALIAAGRNCDAPD